MATNPVHPGCAQPHECSLDTRLRVLEASPLTKMLDEGQRREVDGQLTAWAWADEDPVIFAGEKVDGCYIVASGHMRITRDSYEGREVTVDIAGAGDIVGPLTTDASVEAQDSVWALGVSCALHVSSEALAQIVEKYPQVALAMLNQQSGVVARGREHNAARAVGTVEQRVAGVLVYLMEKFGRSDSQGVLIDVRLRRDDIAGMASTTVESASRALTTLGKQGVINAGRQWIRILDEQELVQRALL